MVSSAGSLLAMLQEPAAATVSSARLRPHSPRHSSCSVFPFPLPWSRAEQPVEIRRRPSRSSPCSTDGHRPNTGGEHSVARLGRGVKGRGGNQRSRKMPISSPLPPPASSPLSPCRCRFPPQHCRLPCESLYEDEEFVQRQLLALVAPKVFFYLAELNGALSYALGAGPLFDVSDDSDYAQTLLAKALDEYAAIQSRATGEEKTMDSGCRLLWKGCWTSAFLMENINRPWVCLLSAGDWINWREQYVSHREYRLETSCLEARMILFLHTKLLLILLKMKIRLSS